MSVLIPESSFRLSSHLVFNSGDHFHAQKAEDADDDGDAGPGGRRREHRRNVADLLAGVLALAPLNGGVDLGLRDSQLAAQQLDHLARDMLDDEVVARLLGCFNRSVTNNQSADLEGARRAEDFSSHGTLWSSAVALLH